MNTWHRNETDCRSVRCELLMICRQSLWLDITKVTCLSNWRPVYRVGGGAMAARLIAYCDTDLQRRHFPILFVLAVSPHFFLKLFQAVLSKISYKFLMYKYLASICKKMHKTRPYIIIMFWRERKYHNIIEVKLTKWMNNDWWKYVQVKFQLLVT